VTDIFNRPPAYELVHDWLGIETVESLLRFAQSNEHRFVDSEITNGVEDRVDRTRRMSKKLSLGYLKGEVRGKVTDLLPLMFDRLCIKPFEPGKIEVELVAHGDGAFFVRHIDTLSHSEGRHRIISAVYYFYALPKAFSGGILRLHSPTASGEEGTFIDVAPDFDTLVFFPSFFPHEVLPIKCTSGRFLDSRFAINIWIRRS